MSAFYFHSDMHDVTALRIRTPKFETHEDAAEHYYRKRMEKEAAKFRRQILYSGLVLMALGIGCYRAYLALHPETLTQFILYMASGSLSVGIAILCCTSVVNRLWNVEEETSAEEKKLDTEFTV